ncbi:PQQ-binding-like beta-propeller repeat protein [Oerskovia sp. Sa1BUA8]|uniref:PQQ-binding-like beta-propeller repeat protein n=1 Tax=Oerskovia douganii TaxID=2762210 RepID=A0A9D5YX60_9CELL|nr:PQQ-binding-like beta-propeller repeat protein [Oerskovia douganii]MBE7699263.1 PQQ-binding-like beta-propeller repeat protein [Oerskovia douganii]
MPRRRQSAAPRAVPFEVVEDLDHEPVTPGGPAGPAGDGEPPTSRGDDERGRDGQDEGPPGAGDPPSGRRTVRWTPWAAGAAVLALVVGGLAIGGKIEERRTAARLVASKGGVLPFTGPPRELWSLDTGDHVWMPFGGMLLRRDAAGTSETVAAVDVLTGQEVWQTAVGPQAFCGRDVYWSAFTPDEGPLLCLSGTPDAMVVSVLGADGQVTGSREVGAVDEASGYAVGPGSTVVHVRRDGPVGPPVGPLELYDENGDATFVEAPGGREVVVTLEDALSGDVLWENRVPFVAPTQAWECQVLDDGIEAALMLDQVTSRTTGQVVTVDGCGIDAAFDADGTRLDDPVIRDDEVLPLTPGTVSRFDPSTMRSVVLDRTGSALWEVTGQILRPSASDGTSEDIVVVGTLSGLAAFHPDGRQLWQVSTSGSTLHVHTSVAMVVDDGANGLTAIDPATGRTLWTVPGEDSVYPFGAATDGAQMVVLSRTADGSARSVGYDLATGEVLWTGTDTQDVGMVGYRGALLQLSEKRVSRVG